MPAPVDQDTTGHTKSYRLDEDRVPTLNTRVKYDLLLSLKDEKVVMVTVGDPEFWKISFDTVRPSNWISIKPSKSDLHTTLHALTKSNHMLTFLLAETSKTCPTCLPDLRVTITPAVEEPKEVPVIPSELAAKEAEVAKLTAALATAKSESAASAAAALAKAQREITALRFQLPLEQRHNYKFRQMKAPFLLEGVFNNNELTYLYLASDDLPALYTQLDGKMAMATVDPIRNPSGHGSTLIMHGVLHKGQLKLGRKKLTITEVPVPPVK